MSKSSHGGLINIFVVFYTPIHHFQFDGSSGKWEGGGGVRWVQIRHHPLILPIFIQNIQSMYNESEETQIHVFYFLSRSRYASNERLNLIEK